MIYQVDRDKILDIDHYKYTDTTDKLEGHVMARLEDYHRSLCRFLLLTKPFIFFPINRLRYSGRFLGRGYLLHPRNLPPTLPDVFLVNDLFQKICLKNDMSNLEMLEQPEVCRDWFDEYGLKFVGVNTLDAVASGL